MTAPCPGSQSGAQWPVVPRWVAAEIVDTGHCPAPGPGSPGDRKSRNWLAAPALSSIPPILYSILPGTNSIDCDNAPLKRFNWVEKF